MKVDVRVIDLEVALPDLIPAIRSLKEELPTSVCIEALLSVPDQRERKLREEFPSYWENFTMVEWRLFIHLFFEKECQRKSLRVIMHGDVLSVDEENEYVESNLVDVHIKNMRKKLRRLGNKHHILTKRAWGYIFCDGPSPEVKSGFEKFTGKRIRVFEKKLNPDGSLSPHPWRKKKKPRLNPVEFGYLKEMKMDDISKEEAGREIKLEGEALDRAWDAKDYDHYAAVRPRMRRIGARVCSICHQPGHYKATCPNV